MAYIDVEIDRITHSIENVITGDSFSTEILPLSKPDLLQEGIDFVIELHIVKEDDHLAMLAFIAACKDRKVEQKRQINKMKQSFRQIAVAL